MVADWVPITKMSSDIEGEVIHWRDVVAQTNVTSKEMVTLAGRPFTSCISGSKVTKIVSVVLARL